MRNSARRAQAWKLPSGSMRPLRIVHALTHNQVTRGGAIQALILSRGQQELGHLLDNPGLAKRLGRAGWGAS